MKDLFNSKEIWAFLSKNDIQVYIGYRGEDFNGEKWYCTFLHMLTHESASIKDGCALVGEYGNGNSPQEAFENNFMVYSGKRAFFGRYKDGREVEIQFPIII